jgi:putative transposase
MLTSNKFPIRKTPDHSPHPRLREDIIFITVNTEGRIPILANKASHMALHSIWHDSTNWIVGRYVIMPDHVHLFARKVFAESIDLDGWVTWWKRSFLTTLNLEPGMWQRGYWDTRMRSPEHYSAKWIYVINNPVRKRLVARSEEWEYQGEIYRLRA